MFNESNNVLLFHLLYFIDHLTCLNMKRKKKKKKKLFTFSCLLHSIDLFIDSMFKLIIIFKRHSFLVKCANLLKKIIRYSSLVDHEER